MGMTAAGIAVVHTEVIIVFRPAAAQNVGAAVLKHDIRIGRRDCLHLRVALPRLLPEEPSALKIEHRISTEFQIRTVEHQRRAGENIADIVIVTVAEKRLAVVGFDPHLMDIRHAVNIADELFREGDIVLCGDADHVQKAAEDLPVIRG